MSRASHDTPVQANRGRLMPFEGGRQILITVHPSYLLRVPSELRAQSYAHFVRDLSLAASAQGD